MLERAGLIIILAYLLVNIPRFRQLLNEREQIRTQVTLIIIFGVFAIISNFTGVEIQGSEVIIDQLFSPLSAESSLANTRVLTIGVSGLIGGPVVGVFTGLVSGFIRYLQGGADPHIYVVSSLLIGIFSGLYGESFFRKHRWPNFKQGAVIGALMEGVQMACILVMGSRLQDSIALVSFIILPMTLSNSIGTAMFLSILDSSRRQEEQTRAVQTHDVLRLANETLPHFRSGLDEASSQKVAAIIKDLIKVDAVSLTNRESILAHAGAASDHHKPSKRILTHLSHEVLETGNIKEAHSHEEIGCQDPNCPLEAAIVIPLIVKGRIEGTLKLYFTDSERLTFVERQIAAGLADIFSTQLELGQVEAQTRLLQDAEIKSLQAQVNPHFFFNALNTISALIRVDSEKARTLLIQLSRFFRSNLQGARTNLIPLSKELEQVEAYRQLEHARFPERVHLHFDMEEELKEALVPPFLIQILVENAFKHAFRTRKTGNQIHVSASKEGDRIRLKVQDNGFGLDDEKVDHLGNVPVASEQGTGSALENLNKRLVNLFGEEAKLRFETNESGTNVTCRLPIKRKEE